MRHTGPGKSENLVNPPRLLLYNFDIDGPQLKPEHERFLQYFVMPTLRSGGSISIVGLASRSGSFSHNERISTQRAECVRSFLRMSVPNDFSVREFKAFGERVAKREHQRDGSEHERYRSVVLFLSAGPQPPVPKLDGLREIPIPPFSGTEGVLDQLGKILDIGSGVTSVLSLVLESILADIAGLAIAALTSIIGMPAIWLESNKFAYQNGQKLGISKALQEMADTYSDDDLRSTPQASWPRLPHPVPHFQGPDESVTVAERSAREGQRHGYEIAWKMIMNMEKEPRVFSVTLKGKPIQIKLSGRQFLYLLHRAFGEDVWRKILQKMG
jgi:hypothetical protein